MLNFLKENKFIVITIICSFAISLSITLSELGESNKITSIGVIVSISSILIVNLQSYKNSKKEVLYNKAEYTNAFVKDFRSLMPGMFWCSELSRNVCESDEKLAKAYQNLSSIPLDFDKENFKKFLKNNNLTLVEVNNILDDFFDDHDNVVDFAYLQNKMNGHIRGCEFDDCYEVFEKTKYTIQTNFKDIISLNAVLENEVIIESKVSEEKEILDLSNENHADKLKDILIEKECKKYCYTLKINEQNVYNDLECVALNSQFGLIDYTKITDLLYAPFNAFIQACYIRLMAAIITEYDTDHTIIFSNIEKLYKGIMNTREDKIEKIEKLENEKKSYNEKIENQKNKNGETF